MNEQTEQECQIDNSADTSKEILCPYCDGEGQVPGDDTTQDEHFYEACDYCQGTGIWVYAASAT